MSDKKKGNEHLLGQPVPGNIPTKIHDTERSPYWYVGLLTMKFPNNEEYFGSGILIVEELTKSKFVLTCAHNLYDEEDGGRAISVSFTRGYSKPSCPYLAVEAKNWYYPENYPAVAISRHTNINSLEEKALHEEITIDYGLLELKESVEINDLPVPVVKKEGDLDDLAVQLNGYGYYDKTMSHAVGNIKYVDETWLTYPISTEYGASGSAIMKNDNLEIVAIHTRRYDKPDGKGGVEKLNRGIRITQEVLDQIQIWMGKK